MQCYIYPGIGMGQPQLHDDISNSKSLNECLLVMFGGPYLCDMNSWVDLGSGHENTHTPEC